MTYVLSNYADIQRVICDIDYAEQKFLKVKKMLDLFIIKYNKKKLTMENSNTLGLFRSVICDIKGNILCMAPPKSISFDTISQSIPYKECELEEFIEGTMINVFWDPTIADWNIATRSNIGARCRFNQDCDYTFRYMFLDAMNAIGMEFSNLNKKICYSFVLQHPQNRIVVPIFKPNLYLAKRYICEGDKVTVLQHNDEYSNINSKYELVKKIEHIGETWDDLVNYLCSDNLDYTIQGIVIFDRKNSRRSKFRSKNYEKVKHLKGNSPKMQYHYYYLRQNGLVKDFLQYYPEYKKLFSDLRSNLHDWTNQLFKNYVECFINKKNSLKNYPYNFKTHMFKLHELYFYELKLENKYINKFEVINYVNNLPPPRLMYSVNYNMRKYTQDTNIANIMK